MKRIWEEIHYRLNLGETWENLSYLLNPCAVWGDVLDEIYHIVDETWTRHTGPWYP